MRSISFSRRCFYLLVFWFSLVFLLGPIGCTPSNDFDKPIERDGREVAFITTPQVGVEKMLELCQPGKDDFVLDLGCGDGRIVITAAKKYGCRGLGFDIDPKLINLCRENAKRQGVDHLVEFRQQDIYKVELPKDATIVTMYLYPEMNLRLLPYLQSLPDERHVVSYRWIMPGVKSDKVIDFETGDKMSPLGTIHYFRTPLLVDPDWKPEPKSAEEKDYEKIKDILKYAKKSGDKSPDSTKKKPAPK